MLESLSIAAICIAGVLWLGWWQSRVPGYWSPWRVKLIGGMGAVFALWVGFIAAAGSGWLD